MSIALEWKDQHCSLRLEDAVDIASASELKVLLIEVLERATEISLNFEKLHHVDVTTLQLIHAAQKAATIKSVPFALEAPLPQSVEETLFDLGWPPFTISVLTQ